MFISIIEPNWDLKPGPCRREGHANIPLTPEGLLGFFKFVMKIILFPCKQNSRKPSSLTMLKTTLKNHSAPVTAKWDYVHHRRVCSRGFEKSPLLSLLTCSSVQESH